LEFARAWFEGYLAAMDGRDSETNPYADGIFWQALDGTVWSWSAEDAAWRGWEPGGQESWVVSPKKFRQHYSDGLAGDR
jgi:hypothetical protein